MGKRAVLLVTLTVLAVAMASCGRASPAEIDQALGITPTPTASAAQMATATAAAAAAEAARTASASSPGAGREVAALGDVTRGSRQFTTQCSGCHGPSGRGPDILSPGSAGADVTAENLLPLIREGANHPVPPGPYPATLLNDAAVTDIAAFIRSRAAP